MVTAPAEHRAAHSRARTLSEHRQARTATKSHSQLLPAAAPSPPSNTRWPSVAPAQHPWVDAALHAPLQTNVRSQARFGTEGARKKLAVAADGRDMPNTARPTPPPRPRRGRGDKYTHTACALRPPAHTERATGGHTPPILTVSSCTSPAAKQSSACRSQTCRRWWSTGAPAKRTSASARHDGAGAQHWC